MLTTFRKGVVVCLLAGCSGPPGSPDAGAVGRFVLGAADLHCVLPDGGRLVQPVDPAACSIASVDGGSPDEAEPPPPRFNAEGDDDDCKYHLKVAASALTQNTDVTLGVDLTSAEAGGAVPGANVMPEVIRPDGGFTPEPSVMSMESDGGHYDMMPVRFDGPGRWTVRFHIFGTCFDAAEDSPHGHAAFFVDVP